MYAARVDHGLVAGMLAAFLYSPSAAFITGTPISVDGGAYSGLQ